MSSKVPTQWLIPSLTANTRSQGYCGFCVTWCPIVWQQQLMLQHLLEEVRPVLSLGSHWSGERSKAHLTLTVLCPLYCCQAGDRVLAVCLSHHWHWLEAEHQQNAFEPILAMGQGVVSHCQVTKKTLQRGLLLYLAQIPLFESIILSSSGIIISRDNMNSNNSSLLQPIPFPSIPCANRGRRVKCSLLLWPGCHLHLPSALHCSISKSFVSL